MTLQDLLDIDPKFDRLYRRQHAKQYEEFVNVFFDDLYDIVDEIEQNPETRRNDSEDRTTIEVCCSLKHMGYEATHDPKKGGHVDIYVCNNRNHKIKGEAKIHRDYGWLNKGTNQLLTRYSTGSKTEASAFLIIYIHSGNVQNVMEKWKGKVGQRDDFKSEKQCCYRQTGFVTDHVHKRTSTTVTVRHIPVNLIFDPKDR